MRSWFRSGSASGCSASRTPGTEPQRARKRRRAFALPRVKFLDESDVGQPVAANNNNSSTTTTTPFMVHCKEIKHICSKCRGTEPRDGESCDQGPGSGVVRLGGRRCCSCSCCCWCWCLSEGDPVRSMTSAEARWSHWRDSGCSCLAPVVMVTTVTAGYASSLWTSHSSVFLHIHLIRLLVGRNQRPLVVTAAWSAECERLLSTFLFLERGARSFRIVWFVAFWRRIS